ncbi:MAG: glycosyltransferase [Microbacterium sp.]|uniref:glycosyltransferase n=1 Tax=Microbacterium sp. TaxID=51671 RepID=UPI001ACD49C0|nr:glycosyltransferase [Microbacterium sp.]MBN9154217.1 glycosyltransferase [Microbacterium sp.]MBN9172979.1 glycosyltransferase [Microbacterium sp.]
MSYLVDFVIAVHDARRPIARAVASVLAAGLDDGRLRVTVVCHNIDREQIAAALGPELAGRVRLLELKDGIYSPAGPFTHGIEAADARFVSIMGSDDYLEPGALGAWAELAAQRGLDVVIPVQRHPSRAVIRNPVVRFRRVSPLDPLKDRLVYRTSPIGLISTALVRRAGLRLTAGVPTGEDQEFSIRLALSGAAIGYAWGRPAYVLGDDAADRTTHARRSVRAEFDALLRMLDEPWFTRLPIAALRAIAVKYVRIHVIAFVRRRLDADDWAEADRKDMAALVERLDDIAPGFRGHLSIADVRALRALADGAPVAQLRAQVVARGRFGTPSTVLPTRPGAVFAADAPLRFMVASALMSR